MLLDRGMVLLNYDTLTLFYNNCLKGTVFVTGNHANVLNIGKQLKGGLSNKQK